MKPVSDLLILGCGYTGKAFLREFPDAKFTHRNTFELSRKETWNKKLLELPTEGCVLWTFPAASSIKERDLAQELYQSFFKNRRTILLGTTSSYQVQTQDELITEESPLLLTEDRTYTEEELRKQGACIVHLAGIFGPERNPLNWYLSGKIQTGRSFLNLIHVNDIVQITKRLFESDAISGQRFNLSNGLFKTHEEIVAELKRNGKLPAKMSLPPLKKQGSKRVSNEKIRRFLSLNPEDFVDYP